MPQLQNSKHEEFARRIAGGEGAESAYIGAGYSRKTAAIGASTLLETPNIRRRIAELFGPDQDSGISAPVSGRLQTLYKRMDELLCIKEARSQDPLIGRLPGGETGLLIAKLKPRKLGKRAWLHAELRFDRDLAREIRATEEDIARELAKEAVRNQSPNVDALSRLSDEEVESSLAILRRLKEAA